MAKERSALLSELLDSNAWSAVLGEIRDVQLQWNRSLLYKLDITEGERRGYILANAAIKNILEKIYQAAGRKWPDAQ